MIILCRPLFLLFLFSSISLAKEKISTEIMSYDAYKRKKDHGFVVDDKNHNNDYDASKNQNSLSLEEILKTANKVIDEKLNGEGCSKQHIDKFKEFSQEWIKGNDFEEIKNSLPLVMSNLEVALERYKNQQCKRSHVFVWKNYNKLQESSISIGDYFKDLWPPISGGNK